MILDISICVACGRRMHWLPIGLSIFAGTFSALSADKNERDTYYWYYATQVMYHMGGDDWEKWNQRLRPMLLDTQVLRGPLAGSWDPLRPVHDRWGPYAGRIYVTAMNLLSLEVAYRSLAVSN